MHEHGKSDKPVVPKKPANNEEAGLPGSSAEQVEGRGLAKGNSIPQTRFRTLCWMEGGHGEP